MKTVRRRAARLAAVGVVLLGGVLVVGATPAMADDDVVRVRAAGSFTAGGSAESVSIEVRKRSDGCVLLRTGLRLRLSGLRADQVEVQVSAGGQWWPVAVSGGGTVETAGVSPVNPRLCEDKRITMRYRVTFLPGAPEGKLTVVGTATTVSGEAIGRGSDTSRVKAGRDATPSPTESPSPTPSPLVSGPPTEEATADPTLVAAGGSGGQAAAGSGGSGGGFSPVMLVGVALVAAGAGLIFLIFRRSRSDRADGHRSADPQVPLPGNPGGTTYRSGAPIGYPAPPAGRPGDPGTVYPSSRGGAPSGTVYPGTPGRDPHYGQAGTVYPSPRPSVPPPPPVGSGGDSTTVMPRLPE